MICFRHQSQPFGDDKHSAAQHDFDNRLFFAQLGENTAGFFAFLQLGSQRRLAFSLQQYNTLFYLIGYSLHFLQQTVVILSAYAQLFRSKGQGSFINLRHSVQRAFNLGTAVSAVQILHQIDSALAAQLRTTVTRYYHYVGLNRCADFLNFRQQSLMVCSAEAQLLGSKAYVGIGYAGQLFNFIFHFGSAVGTAKVLQNIYTLNFIGIRHTAGAISQAFAAYIAVFLMRMADFAITVSRMTGNVMSVCVSVFMSVVMSAAAFITMCMSVCVCMFMLVVMSAATFVAVRVGMFMLVAVVMTATAFITVCVGMLMLVFMSVVVSATTLVAVRVSVFFVLVVVLITTAAVVTMSVSVFMLMLVVARIAMSMLGNMSHSVMIMILAAVTAGAAFRMLAVVFYAIDMAVDVSESSYIAGAVTNIL